MVAARPLGILGRGDLVPQGDGVGAARALGRVRVDVVPRAVLQGDGEDVRDRVVERLSRRGGVVLLRVARARADHVVRVVAGVQDDGCHVRGVAQLGALGSEAAGEVDPRLGLILGRVLLRVRVEDRALGLALGGERHVVRGIRSAQHPRDDAVLALVDGGGAGLAAHRAVDGFDGHLPGEGGCVRLPRGDLALARLAGGGGGVERLTDRLVDRLLVEVEQGADAGGGGGAEVGDVVDLVLVQRDGADEVDLHLVRRREGADDRRAVAAGVLGDRHHGRDVVAGVRVVGGEEGVVVVELADRDAVGPRGPLGAGATLKGAAEHGPADPADRDGVVERLLPRGAHRTPRERGGRNGGVVDDAVDDHVHDVVVDRHRVDGDARQGPRQLPLAREVLVAAVDAEVVGDRHARAFRWGEGAASSRDSRMLVRALCRCTWVACAARSASPAAIAAAISRCSDTEAASRSGW